MLVYLAVATPPAILGLMFLLATGCSALWLAVRMWQATTLSLILTDYALYDSKGREIAPLDGVERIERGLFAMKPSNGFTLVLDTPGPRVWEPGVWWRAGRRVAIGGVLAAHQTRPVADILTAKVAERQAR